MFKFVVVVAFIASANAGLISPAVSYAAGPALGAPLVGRVSVNPAEVNIVKQQVVVDQPEIRYRAVPTVVQTAPIVQQVVAAPAVAAVRTVVQAPAVVQAPVVAAPQIAAVKTIQAPVVQQVVAAPAIQTIAAAPAVQYAAPAVQYAAPAFQYAPTLQYAAQYAAPAYQYAAAPAFQTVPSSLAIQAPLATQYIGASPSILALKK